MTSMLLVGAFGQDNPGDDALLESFLDAFGTSDLIVAARDPADIAERYGCAAIEAEGASVLRCLKTTDIVVAAGGTIFKLLHPSACRSPLDLLRKAFLLTSTAKAMGKLVALVGVGAGRVEGATARALVRGIARRADLMILRDEESASVLTSCGVPGPFRVGADPTWTLLDRPPARPRDDGVVVALSHLAGNGQLAGQLACGLQPLVERGVRVELQPWQGNGGGGDAADFVLARQVRGLLDRRVPIIGRPSDLRAASHLFAQRRAVIGFRYHALVASALGGTPFVSIAHEPKLAAVARRMAQPCIDAAFAPARLSAALSKALSSPAPCPAAVDEQHRLAQEGFRLLRLLDPDAPQSVFEDLDGLPLHQPA